MSYYHSLETHPLKCLKQTEGYNSHKVLLGPPDVYQQEYKQKEDLLTEFNVREGFNYSKPVVEEHESAKDIGFEFISKPFLTDLNNFMQAVIVKSHNNNIKQDTTKRKVTVATLFKDLQCIPAIEKSKEIIYDWMIQLSDTIPYAELINKRIPYFHKKEDVLKEIFKYQVPITRAIWFIKVSAMHATIQAESNKKKPRSNVDSLSDWVLSFIRTLNEKLDLIRIKLMRNTIDHEYEMTVSEFEYLMRLMVAMYDEDLLDHTEVLQWLVSTNEQCSDDEQMMKFYLPFLLYFGDRFKESEILTRKLLHGLCNSVNLLLTNNKHPDRSITDFYAEYSSCSTHRTVMFCLSGLIVSLSLECPCAVVYNNIKIPGHNLNGSPLDLLPCALSALPCPPGQENNLNRDTIAKLEQFILQRSLAVENQWKHESFECSIEQTAAGLIKVVELLDRYDYNCYKDSSVFEGLCTVVVSLVDNHSLLLMLLCEWSVSTMRTGTHRPFLVAQIIDNIHQNQSHQSIQNCLVEFLDTKSPIIDSQISADSEPFRNLVCLFGELIERELFSMNDYMSYMIARGLFESVANLPLPPIGGFLSVAHNSSSSSHRKSPELDRMSTGDNPDSVRSECSGLNQILPSIPIVDYRNFNRHLQYLIHFPIPVNDDYVHEHNLRSQKLYCTSRTRDANKQFLRRLAKDIGKMYTKRGYMFDIIQIEKSRKKSRRDPREESMLIEKLAESIQSRFKCLTYYDMECVLSQCLPTCVNSLNIHSILANKLQSTSNMFLPYPTIISTLLNLIEQSCNYSLLIRIIDECSLNLVKLIEHLSRQGLITNYSLIYSYMSRFRICIIGFLFKFQSVLMTMSDCRCRIFHGIFVLSRNFVSVNGYVNRCSAAVVIQQFQSCATLRSCPTFVMNMKKLENVFRNIKPDKDRSSSIDYVESVGMDLFKINMVSCSENVTELQLNVNLRFSLVVNCLLHVVQCTDVDQLARINTIIVETVSNASMLSTEWITAIYSLLLPGNASPGYEQFVNKFNSLLVSNDLLFYENISTLIATMLARQCFYFSDFLGRVICVALAQGIDQQSIVCPPIVPTTRLASYILFRLFTMEQQNSTANSVSAFKKEDVNLLSSSLQKVTTELLVDLLKMLAVHSDKGRLQDQDYFDLTENNQVSFGPPFRRSIDTEESFIHMKIWNFTLRVLREICCVSWVRIRFSQETPSRLIRDNVLIDKNISNSQARNLLNIICHPKDHLWQTSCTSKDIIDTMNRTFTNLNIWSLHFDQMKIQLLLTQIPEEERKDVIENVSKDIINLFKNQAEQQANQRELVDDDYNDDRYDQYHSQSHRQKPTESIEINSAYLIPSLINKLPFDNFKRQLIAAASEKLESGKHFCTHKNYQDKENDLTKSSLILTYPPFISLLIVCLAKDDNRSEFLKSLADQIEYYIDNAKETEKMPDDLRVKHLIHTSMKSRLALVGYLFDRIQESWELIGDWCLLLSKLIIYGVVEMHSDHSELFYTVLDMISTLIHTLFSIQNHGIKFFQMIKKLRKEICDKLNYEGVELIKPFLLPCFKNTYDVIVTVPLRMPHKSQQYRLTTAEKSGKQGCAVQRKERINPWEVIEGIKNLFSLSWFAAVSCDTPVLPIEEHANLMIGHDHPDKLIRPDNYYTSFPEILPEDIKDPSISDPMEIINSSGPPSVQNGINNSNNNTSNHINNINSNSMENPRDNNPGSVKINQENPSMPPLTRPRSNASSGIGPTKRKKPKRSNNQSNSGQSIMANQISNHHPMSRNVLSPAILPGNPNLMMRHHPPGMSMVPPNGNIGLAIAAHRYPNHGIDYSGYGSHQIGSGFSELPSNAYLQSQHYSQSVYDSNQRANQMSCTRPNRTSRSNINQTLKSKIQQRQPSQDHPMLSSFHGNTQQQQQQSILPPPPPYHNNSSSNIPLEDINNVAPVPPPNYNNPTLMNNYQLTRTYSDSSMQQYMQQQQQQQQQQSRLHPSQYNRYGQF